MVAGADVSNKTLLTAAANALPVRFTLGLNWVVTGYLCGMDSFHWKAVEMLPDGGIEVHLIHKTQAVATVLEHGTPWTEIKDETEKARIEAIVAPFRKHAATKNQGATTP